VGRGDGPGVAAARAAEASGMMERPDQAPVPIGHVTPVPPIPQ